MDDRLDTKIAMTKRVRRPEDGELDITPMIDIVFLLLAFFVVVSKMDPTTIVDMPRAKYGDSIPERTAVIVVVEAVDRDEPKVYRGRSKSPETLCAGSIDDIENQIADYVKSTMDADALKSAVIIKAERKVKYRHMDIVKRAVSRDLAEDQRINIGIEEE